MGGSFYAELLAAADSRAEDDEANGRAMKHLTDSFSSQPLAALTADEIELYLRKRLLPANPCWGVESPVRVKGMLRPHYMTWSEQQTIEFHAPGYLANTVR